MTMRSFVTILLLVVGAVLGLCFAGLIVAFTVNVGDLIVGEEWPKLGRGLLITAITGLVAWASLATGWRRRADLNDIRLEMPSLPSNKPRVPLTVFLAALAGAFVVVALIVAFGVNPIELPEYMNDDFLPWDPTHTARKYVWLAVLAVGSAYWVFRYARQPLSIALIPALMFVLAIPIGATGYECVANRWSFVSWIVRSDDNLEALRQDPYVYLSHPREGGGLAVRVRPDVLEGLQFMRASGFQSDWDLLEEMEAESDVRRRTGIGLLMAFGVLAGGAGFLFYRGRAGLSDAET